MDLVYRFAAAHHCAEHRKTLAEIERILKPGGRALFLHEPPSKVSFVFHEPGHV